MEKRKRNFIGSSLQKKVLALVFISAFIPALVVAACLYYLVFAMLAEQLGISEMVAFNLLPILVRVNTIILISLPVILGMILLWALEISHRIAGPVLRLEKALDDHISGDQTGPIVLREKDELKPLADKINELVRKTS